MGVSLFFFFTKYTKCNKNEGKKKVFFKSYTYSLDFS